MHISIERSAAMRRSSKKQLGAVATAVVLVATGAATMVGSSSFADDDDNAPVPIDAPSGELVADEPLIVTAGPTFDETVLSKFIPAGGFERLTGSSFGDESLIRLQDQVCLRPNPAANGTRLKMFAPVELPDGARIKQITFFGLDDDGAEDVEIALIRSQWQSTPQMSPLPPEITPTVTEVDAFTTDGLSGDLVVQGADDLDEVAGSPVLDPTSTYHRFHTVEVNMFNSAGADHVLCGVTVDYQVPVSSEEAGDQFHPVGPIRVYDSREGSFTPNGILTPNSNRVIDITDGYDLDGNAIPAQADTVPSDATAITYNITVTTPTGANFTSVTAGDAASFTTSAINFGPGDELANAGTVTISNGEIKLWGGNGAGSTHVVIDVTGYYAPGPPPSNMGN